MAKFWRLVAIAVLVSSLATPFSSTARAEGCPPAPFHPQRTTVDLEVEGPTIVSAWWPHGQAPWGTAERRFIVPRGRVTLLQVQGSLWGPYDPACSDAEINRQMTQGGLAVVELDTVLNTQLSASPWRLATRSGETVSAPPTTTDACAGEEQEFSPHIEQGGDRLVARNITPPCPGWWGVIFVGFVDPGGPRIIGILGVHTPEVRFVEAIWIAKRSDPGPRAIQIAEDWAKSGGWIQLWEGRELTGPRMVREFNRPAVIPPAPGPAPTPVADTAACPAETRQISPLLGQSFNGRTRAVIIPPADFPTQAIVAEGNPWRDSPIHVEIHRSQQMEVVYHSMSFHAVCGDPVAVAQRFGEIYRAANRWVQIWDVRPSGPRVLVNEFNRPAHLPSIDPAAPAQCGPSTPSPWGIPPGAGDDLARDIPVVGPAVVEVQFSSLVSRPTWAQDRTILTVVVHDWQGVFQKVRHIAVWSYSPACTAEHIQRELGAAADRTRFEIHGIEEIRGHGLFVKN